MRLRQLSLIRYGKFTDRLLEFPPAARDIHLIVGPNEAGKSTTRTAIGDLLFGIHPRTPLDFVHAKSELRLGAVLEGDEGRRLAFERSKALRQTLREPGADGKPLPDDALQPWLGDLTRPLFEQMHGLDHEALVRGGDGILSDKDDLSRLLFQSAAGLDQVGAVLAALEQEEGALWGPRKAAGREYHAALAAFEQATAELKAASVRARDWKERAAAVREAEQALAAVQGRQAEVRGRRARLERVRRVQPVLQRLDESQARWAALADAVLLPEDAAAVLAEGVTDSARARDEQQRHAQALAEAQAALAALVREPALLAREAEIRALGEMRLQLRGHRGELARLQPELQALDERVRHAAAALGRPVDALPSAALRDRLEQLLRQRDALVQQAEAAARGLQAKRQEQAQAEAALQALPPAGGRPGLQLALERARRLGEHEQQLHELQLQQDRAEAALQAALARLGRWTQPVEALRAMLSPDAALIAQLLDEQRRDEQARQAAETQLQARRAELQTAQQELAQLIATWQPVSREQVLAARVRRDADWRELRARPAEIEARAAAYERAVADADARADARLERIQHEAERHARAQRLELLALTLTQDEARLAALVRKLADAAQHWQDLTRGCGLPALPLALAADWCAARARALEADDACQDAARQRSARMAQGEAVRAALLNELDGAAPTLDFAHALRLAEDAAAQLARDQGRRATLEQQVAEAGRALLGLQEADAAARSQRERWQQQWDEACAEAGLVPDAALLAALAGLAHDIERARALRDERIAPMAQALARLAAEARALAQDLAPDRASDDTDALVLALLARADAAVRAEADAIRHQRAIDAAREGQAMAGARLQAVGARLALLARLAGTEDHVALARAVELSAQRRQLARERQSLREQLIQGGDGLAEDALRAELAEVDAGEPARAELLDEEDRLLQQARELGAAHEKARAQLAGVDGSDRAARADAVRHEAVARMAAAALGYAKARAASRLLKWSIEQYRQTQQGPLLASASALFATLTGDSFSRLVVDAGEGSDGGRPRLQGLRPEGGRPVGVEGMSEGTRDQLYLALRLAALQLQAQQSRRLPLVADDLFINFDERRSAAGLRALGELSRHTQVLFLTHHAHLAELASEVLGPGLNLVRL